MESVQAGCTRRTALAAGAAGGVVLWLGSAAADTAHAEPGIHPALTRSGWASLVGRDVTADGTVLKVTAVGDVADAAARRLHGSEEAFVVSFTGSATHLLESGIHEIAEPSFGSLALFISPVDARGATQHYEIGVDRVFKLARRAPAGTAEPQADATRNRSRSRRSPPRRPNVPPSAASASSSTRASAVRAAGDCAPS